MRKIAQRPLSAASPLQAPQLDPQAPLPSQGCPLQRPRRRVNQSLAPRLVAPAARRYRRGGDLLGVRASARCDLYLVSLQREQFQSPLAHVRLAFGMAGRITHSGPSSPDGLVFRPAARYAGTAGACHAKQPPDHPERLGTAEAPRSPVPAGSGQRWPRACAAARTRRAHRPPDRPNLVRSTSTPAVEPVDASANRSDRHRTPAPPH